MNYVGPTPPPPPRVQSTSATVAVAPTPVDRAAGDAPRRERAPAEGRPDQNPQGSRTGTADPAIRIAGALTALFAGEVVEAIVEAPPPGAAAALRLPEGRLVAARGALPEMVGTALQIRLSRSGAEPMVEVLGPAGKSREPPVILQVSLDQRTEPSPSAGGRIHPGAKAAAGADEALLPAGGIVSLPAMMGRVAVHVPANAAYLHTVAGLPDATGVPDPVLGKAESVPVPLRFGADWDALWTALEANPLVADRARDLLPARDALRLAGGLLFLSTILRHGTIRHWLGDEAVGRLAATSPQNYRRAQTAFDDLAAQAREQGGDGWRAVPLALIDTSQVQPVMLYVHRPPRRRKTDPDPAGGATRFMIDMTLSAAGPLRIDGLFRQRLLDLFIRTERPVPRVIAQDLKSLYGEVLAAGGLTGRLEFQTVTRLPPAPVARPDLPGAALTA